MLTITQSRKPNLPPQMIDINSINEPHMPMIHRKATGPRPRVMLFTDSFSRGGTEQQFVRFVRGIDRNQYDILIACLQRNGPLLSEVESLGVSIVEFPIDSLYNFKAAKLFVQLVRFLRREQIQIVHTFDFYTSIFAVPAARLAGVPVVLGQPPRIAESAHSLAATSDPRRLQISNRRGGEFPRGWA